MRSHCIYPFLLCFILTIIVQQTTTQLLVPTDDNLQTEFIKGRHNVLPGENIVVSRLKRATRSRIKRSPLSPAMTGRPPVNRPPPTPSPTDCHYSCSFFPQYYKRSRGNPAMRIRMMDYDNEMSIVQTGPPTPEIVDYDDGEAGEETGEEYDGDGTGAVEDGNDDIGDGTYTSTDEDNVPPPRQSRVAPGLRGR